MRRSLSRREILSVGVGAAGASLFVGCAPEHVAKDASAPHPGLIDAHSHVWSSDTRRFPVGPWVKPDQMAPPSFTAEQLLEIARPNGVERIVIIQHSPYFGYDPAYLIDCRRRYPGVFSIVAMIDERKPDLSSRLARLREQGVRGIRVNPQKHGDRTPVVDPPNWLNAPEMGLLWKIAQEQNIAICPLLPPELLPTLDPICARFPNVACVIDHLGGVDLNNPADVANLLRLARHPNVYVKVSAFYKFGARKPPYDDLAPLIRKVFDAYGPRRLMWGSDCPYQLQNGNNYRDSVALVRDRLNFLGESDRRAILRDTAERVFFA